MIKYIAVTILIGSSFTLAGCSVGMAMSGQEQKDTSILFPGSPRPVVIAKIGPPETSTVNKDGSYIDSYLITKGNEPSTGRAVAHGALDIVTLGLWELIGTPMEMGASGEDVSRYIIYYDTAERIKDIQKIRTDNKEQVAAKQAQEKRAIRRKTMALGS